MSEISSEPLNGVATEPAVMDSFDMSPESLENSLLQMDVNAIDEFNSSVNFEKFIVLSKKDVSNVCRMVDSLAKSSVDEYGKSVFITCLSPDVVEFRYWNNPYFVAIRVNNKSNKSVKDFAMSLTNLKKLVTSSYASIILVEDENGDMNIAVCESLLYLETKPLSSSQYQFERKPAENLIDRELASYTFRRLGSVLSLTERASEKVFVIKDGFAHLSTGVFASRSVSPFSTPDNFVLYKAVSDLLAVLSELSKTDLKYTVDGSTMTVTCDDVVYCSVPIGSEAKVPEFLSPLAETLLSFKATCAIVNDSFLRLISIVKSLDYLSDIITLDLDKSQLQLVIATTNQSKSSTYQYSLVEGTPEMEGSLKMTADVLQVFLGVVGNDFKFTLNQNGFGIENSKGVFLIRKS